MNRKLTCIICPRGCTLDVTGEKDSLTVTGHACRRGRDYAIAECTHPVRTITSSIRVSNREDCMVSVKTLTPVAKEDIFTVMQAIRSAAAQAPVKTGDVLIENLCGTRIVATKDIY